MDKGTWIALAVMGLATIGVAVLLMMPPQDNNSAPSSGAPADAAPAVATAQNCQSLADTAAAQDQSSSGENTSVIETAFNSSTQVCYYEVNIFGAAGNTASIRSAPSDATIASCTTSPAGALSCQKGDGTAITEPQFKALLTSYLSN